MAPLKSLDTTKPRIPLEDWMTGSASGPAEGASITGGQRVGWPKMRETFPVQGSQFPVGYELGAGNVLSGCWLTSNRERVEGFAGQTEKQTSCKSVSAPPRRDAPRHKLGWRLELIVQHPCRWTAGNHLPQMQRQSEIP